MFNMRLFPAEVVNHNATHPSFRDFSEFQISIMIWKIVSPMLIIVGSLGSLLSLLVLCRKQMRASTTMFYLAVLSVADVFVLYTGLLRYWLHHTFSVDVRLLSTFACKCHIFLVYSSLDYAAWILVALTVDRCICVCAPFQSRKYCVLRKARLISVVILIFVALINVHMFWTYGLSKRTIFGDGLDCDAASEDLKTFVTKIWPWIDFCTVCFFPFTIMIICNIILVRQLTISTRNIRRHVDSESEGRGHGTTLGVPDDPSEHQSPKPKVSTISASSRTTKSKSVKTSNLTVMLLSVSCLFLILTSPIVVYLIGFGSWRTSVDPHTEAKLHLGWTLVNMLQYTNNAGHFFLYCLSGPRFRRVFISLIRRKNKVTTEPSISVFYNGP